MQPTFLKVIKTSVKKNDKRDARSISEEIKNKTNVFRPARPADVENRI
jgi:hypothetical protein